jgi:UDP-sugar pyrophosphorylase
MWDMNSLAVPRFAKEAIGAICRLESPDGRAMTVNVEYNQLDALLRGSGYPDGACKHA